MLLFFLGLMTGGAAIIVIELLELQALIAPFRDIIEFFFQFL